jgi:hypothetical protein
MNKHFDLEPTPFKGMSRVIGGRPLTESETASGEFVGDDVGGLPVMETNVGYVSRWRCTSLWWRLVFLFTGKINLKVSTKSHPPVAMYVGEP